jgi:hypothetical protein
MMKIVSLLSLATLIVVAMVTAVPNNETANSQAPKSSRLGTMWHLANTYYAQRATHQAVGEVFSAAGAYRRGDTAQLCRHVKGAVSCACTVAVHSALCSLGGGQNPLRASAAYNYNVIEATRKAVMKTFNACQAYRGGNSREAVGHLATACIYGCGAAVQGTLAHMYSL